MPDIALVTINAKWIHPSLGLRLLKANLAELEERCHIYEFATRQDPAVWTETLLAAKPRIIAFSVSIWNHTATLSLLRALESRWIQNAGAAKKPFIVMGGPEAANLPPDSEILTHVDWLIKGEGELAFRDLCRIFLSDAGTEAVARRGLRIVEATELDLSAIDPGYRLYTDEDLNRKLTYVEASRGCPFGCEFCLSSTDRRVREFPLDPFLAGMETLIARGARSFKFLDRTFNLDAERARAIMVFFLERLVPGMFVHFEMIPGRFPLELREMLSRFPPGSLRLEVGIQTFNPTVAARVGRASKIETELDTLRFLRDHTNAIVHADLIAGLPGEDFASFGSGFDLLWSAGPDEIQPGILKRLPGTTLARHDKAFSMSYSAEPPYEVISTSTLSREELDRLKNFARFWELIVNRGHFPSYVDRFFPPDQLVFDSFMKLADILRARFGRDWGIARNELREAIEAANL
jgi:radical SAM superfamily enzyme YgiQ (UPF0313 family)